MFRKSLLIVALAAALAPTVLAGRWVSGIMWPEPPTITPGEGTAPPSDAIVLFDGKNFDAWKGAKVAPTTVEMPLEDPQNPKP